MGIVFRPREPLLDREVAVKVLQDHLRGDAHAVERFRTEARVTAQLQHPGVPPVFEVGELADGSPYLVMKLIRGLTLAELLADRAHAAAELPRFFNWFELVCQAVAYAHHKGVVHRDLKPANVMVGAFGEVQVMDWGLAKVLAPDGAGGSSPAHLVQSPMPSNATCHGGLLGTPAYMAPEQARGEPADTRTDVFALGAILFEILTGQKVYGVATGDAVLHRAAREQFETSGPLRSSPADPELSAICRRCLEAKPDRRYPDAEEVAHAVGAYRSGLEDRLRAAVQRRRSTNSYRGVFPYIYRIFRMKA
jgi:serine/threonine protein kinase